MVVRSYPERRVRLELDDRRGQTMTSSFRSGTELPPFLADLESRSLVSQKTVELTDPLLADTLPPLYVGYDPSAGSLHAGSLIPLLGMDRYKRRGGQIIVLLGGATGLIGDPSGKDRERTLETDQVIARRIGRLKRQVSEFFGRTEGPEPSFVNNADWYRDMHVIAFLRDVGKNFSVNQMLTRDSVRTRIENREQGISFTEFSYQLLQSYDFLHLFREHGCRIQMGASDQWGNIVSGVDLVRRAEGAAVYGLTFPLLTNSEGKKYGKSEQGAVWLDPELTSPYEFYQFWLNSADDDVGRFLRWLTDLSSAEIESLATAPPHERRPQKALATALTVRVHGARDAETARQASRVIFSGKAADMDTAVADMVARSVPTLNASPDLSCPVADAMVRVGAGPSKGAARRLVKQNAVSVNGTRVSDANEDLLRHRAGAGVVVLSVGKSRRYLVRFR
jgi:tyrosyl-tRNA synthetase